MSKYATNKQTKAINMHNKHSHTSSSKDIPINKTEPELL